MKKRTVIAFTFLLSLSMFQCKKDDGHLPNPVPSREEMIAGKSSKSYTITKEIYNGVDITNNQEPCDMDDIVTFNANHTYQETEGATKCNPSDDNIVDSGTWKLNKEQDTLYIDDIPFYINSINKKEMTITGFDDGDVEQVTLTAK